MIQIGGVYTTLCHEKGILCKSIVKEMGGVSRQLFKNIGVRGRFDSPDSPRAKRLKTSSSLLTFVPSRAGKKMQNFQQPGTCCSSLWLCAPGLVRDRTSSTASTIDAASALVLITLARRSLVLVRIWVVNASRQPPSFPSLP